jgi:hypothetical protein
VDDDGEGRCRECWIGGLSLGLDEGVGCVGEIARAA